MARKARETSRWADGAPTTYPREIEFVTALPKMRSGKIQRFILQGGA